MTVPDPSQLHTDVIDYVMRLRIILYNNQIPFTGHPCQK